MQHLIFVFTQNHFIHSLLHLAFFLLNISQISFVSARRTLFFLMTAYYLIITLNHPPTFTEFLQCVRPCSRYFPQNASADKPEKYPSLMTNIPTDARVGYFQLECHEPFVTGILPLTAQPHLPENQQRAFATEKQLDQKTI